MKPTKVQKLFGAINRRGKLYHPEPELNITKITPFKIKQGREN